MGTRVEGSAVGGTRVSDGKIAESRGARPARSIMPTVYVTCMSLTKEGHVCKMPVMKDGKYCVSHARARGLTDVYENTD